MVMDIFFFFLLFFSFFFCLFLFYFPLTPLSLSAAAAVNWMMPYASLRAANVEGTKQAIEFVRASPGRLLFVGTAGVATADARDDGADGPSFYEPVQALSGYSQSKWVAEKFVHAAIRHHGM